MRKVDDVDFCAYAREAHTHTHTHMYTYVYICASSWSPTSSVASVHAEASSMWMGWDAIARNVREKGRENADMNGMCSTFDTGNLRGELYVRNAYFTNRDSSDTHAHRVRTRHRMTKEESTSVRCSWNWKKQHHNNIKYSKYTEKISSQVNSIYIHAYYLETG